MFDGGPRNGFASAIWVTRRVGRGMRGLCGRGRGWWGRIASGLEW